MMAPVVLMRRRTTGMTTVLLRQRKQEVRILVLQRGPVTRLQPREGLSILIHRRKMRKIMKTSMLSVTSPTTQTFSTSVFYQKDRVSSTGDTGKLPKTSSFR